jgi:hypothetical protein
MTVPVPDQNSRANLRRVRKREICVSEYVQLSRTAAMLDGDSDDSDDDDYADADEGTFTFDGDGDGDGDGPADGSGRGTSDPLLPPRSVRRLDHAGAGNRTGTGSGRHQSLHTSASRFARRIVRRRLCGGGVARGSAAAGGGLRLFHWLAATGYLLSLATGQLFLALSYVWTQRLNWAFQDLLYFYCGYHAVYAVAAPFWAFAALRCSPHKLLALGTLGQATVIAVPFVRYFVSATRCV